MTIRKAYRCEETTLTRAQWLEDKGIKEDQLKKDEHGEFFPREIRIEGDPIPQQVYLPANIQRV
jgi:hypothetical protein